MIRNLSLRLIFISKLVAVAARDRKVTPSQLELRLLMLRQREGCRAVTLQVVALIALVLVRLPGKLVVVLILVTIGTVIELRNPENRFLAFWNVALTALHFCVTVDQRIVRFGVRLHVE